MKKELSPAWARLRGSLYATKRREPHGTCRVLQADLELLLAEVEQLSNAQMARFLVKITLEALNNGEQGTSSKAARAAERRARRHPVVRGADRAAAAGRVAEIAGPFSFGDGPLQEF